METQFRPIRQFRFFDGEEVDDVLAWKCKHNIPLDHEEAVLATQIVRVEINRRIMPPPTYYRDFPVVPTVN